MKRHLTSRERIVRSYGSVSSRAIVVAKTKTSENADPKTNPPPPPHPFFFLILFYSDANSPTIYRCNFFKLLLFVIFFIHFLNLLRFIECWSPSLLIKARRCVTTILFIIQELGGTRKLASLRLLCMCKNNVSSLKEVDRLNTTPAVSRCNSTLTFRV